MSIYNQYQESFLIITIYDQKTLNNMYKYPQMISLLAKHYPTFISKELQEVGRHCLKSLYYHIVYSHQISMRSHFVIEHFQDILVQQFKLNHEQVLLAVVANQVFIEECRRFKEVIMQTLRKIINEYNCSDKEESFIRKKKQKGQQKDDNSFQDTEDQIVQDQLIVETLNTQLNSNREGQFIQNYVPLILAKQNPSETPYHQEIIAFIASVTAPKTQISVFCQQFKIKYPEYKRDKHNEIYIIKGQIYLDTYFTSYVPKYYEAESRFANLKRAENEVALQLLQKIWIEYPEAWIQYSRIKKQKNLK